MEVQATPLIHVQPCLTIIRPYVYQHQQRSTVPNHRTDPDSDEEALSVVALVRKEIAASRRPS